MESTAPNVRTATFNALIAFSYEKGQNAEFGLQSSWAMWAGSHVQTKIADSSAKDSGRDFCFIAGPM